MQQPPYDQSGFYNQPTSQYWAGQQSPQQQPPPQKPPKKRRRLWLILGIIGGAVLLCCIVSSVATALTPSAPATHTTPTTAATQGAILAITVTTTPTATATASPTPNPKPTATATPRPVVYVTPTPRPQPTATHCVGINGNPWCYDFNSGKTITYPPNGFCGYFNCIATFYAPDDPGDGYVVECSDGAYSQSGGESGACSSHGGVGRTLYAH
jgi:hypothetical protein